MVRYEEREDDEGKAASAKAVKSLSFHCKHPQGIKLKVTQSFKLSGFLLVLLAWMFHIHTRAQR